MECYHYLSTALKIIGKKYTTIQEEFSTADYTIFLAKYTAVRGCEFPNVILAYPSNERHLKQHIVAGLSRCMYNLKIIVFDYAVCSSLSYACNSNDDNVLLAILNKWRKKSLVKTYRLVQRSKFTSYLLNEKFYLKGNTASLGKLCNRTDYSVFKNEHRHLKYSYEENVE